MTIEDTMKIVQLQEELKHVRQQLTMHHNGMIDISIMLEEDDYDAAKAKALSFVESPEEDEPCNSN